MSSERLDVLLNELLPDDSEDEDEQEETHSDLGLSLETRLFDAAELEAALSSCTDTPQEPTSQGDLTAVSLTPEPVLSHVSGSETSSKPEREQQFLKEKEEDLLSDRAQDLKRLDQMEESIRSFVAEGDSTASKSVLDRLKDRLKTAANEEWNPEGRPDANGGMIGGSVSLSTSLVVEPIVDALQNEARYGIPQVISQVSHRGSSLMTAVGTSRGMLLIQLQSLSNQETIEYELFELGDPRSLGTITCLACSRHSDKDKVLLSVGNAEGNISIWDVLAKKCMSNISSHTTHICCMAFHTIKTSLMLLSSDKKGAFHCHTITSWVVRTTVSTKVLAEGNRKPMMFAVFPNHRTSNDDASDSSDSKVSIGEGMICLSHPNLCSIGRLMPDSRLSIFYQIPKPDAVSPDTLPIASWTPFGKVTYAHHSNPDIDGCIPYGQLALSWGNTLSLMNIPLLGDTTMVDAPHTRRGPSRMEVSDYVRLAHEVPILTLANWQSEETDSVLLHLCWLSPHQLLVVRKSGILSQILLFDTSLKVTDKVELDDYPVAIVLQTGEATLTAIANAVSLQELKLTIVGGMRLKICRLLEWEDAVSLLIQIQKWMMASHLLVAFHCQAKNIQYLPNVGVTQSGVRDIHRITQLLSTVLLQLLDNSLKIAEEETQVTDLLSLAELTMDICILTNQSTVLFEEVFPRFVAANGREIFLSKLEQALSSNELQSRVPPEVMQSLVEYCCNIEKPGKVERCVLRMDIASLDLNQVIPLCICHNLFVALLYIYNNSLLRDCITPALYLTNAILLAQSKEQAYKYGMNLFVYIRCCLRGEPYPPGISTVEIEEASKTKEKVKCPVLGFILFTELSDLENALQRMSRDARKEESNKSSENMSSILTGPYPVLQCLLSIDANLVTGVLSEALEDWECIEKDLLEAYSNGKVEEMETVRSVTQVIVDSLVCLLEKFPKDKDILLNYISHRISSGRATVVPDVALMLLEHLAYSSQGTDSSRYVYTAKEKLFCGIVKSVGVELDSSTNERSTFSQLEGQKALGLATDANLLSAAALLHHMFQDYQSALRHYLLIGKSYSTRPFVYFEEAVSHFIEYQNSIELEKLQNAALSVMSQLASVNPEQAATMVMKHFPNDQKAVIQGLCGSRPLLFKYLKSAMEGALSKADAELSHNLNQLLTKSHCTLYVNLMCEYDSGSVLPFLQTYDHLVDVQACKEDCLSFGLHDAAAHLLEREGDAVGALKILTEKIENVNSAMEKTIVSKELDDSTRLLSQQLSLSAILRVSDFPDARLQELPNDIYQAQTSLSSAIKLCRRSSVQRNRPTSADNRRMIETLSLWFSLLTVYINALRGLPRHMSKKLKRVVHSSVVSHWNDSLKHSDQFNHYPQLAYLRDVYTALMDEVISAMADYVSLVDVAERIITMHATDKFGDFRSALLSLINAYNYEQNILTSIDRLLSADAYHVLKECYKKRTQALRIEKQE